MVFSIDMLLEFIRDSSSRLSGYYPKLGFATFLECYPQHSVILFISLMNLRSLMNED